MIHCSAYFFLLRNIFIIPAMAGGKWAPEVKRKPSCKLTAIDLEIEITMVHKCEGGQSLTAIACELGSMVAL
jgi:hypothetical protein